MMLRTVNKLQFLSLFACLFSLIGCSQSGFKTVDNKTIAEMSSYLSQSTKIDGMAMLGPVSGAQVSAFINSVSVATGLTAADGSFALDIPNSKINGQAVLIEITGGSYKEEANGSSINLSGKKVRAILPSLTPGIPAILAVTPLTELAYQVFTSGSTAASANTSVALAFGLDDIITTKPSKPQGQLPYSPSGKYTTMLLAISKLTTANGLNSMALPDQFKKFFVASSAADPVFTLVSLIDTANAIQTGSILIPGVQAPSNYTPISSHGLLCHFAGQIMSTGTVTSGYSAANVPYGSNCSSVAVTVSCNNGVYQPSTALGSCAALGPSSCTFAGNTIPSGGSVVGYTSSTVPFGGNCSTVSTQVKCTNGILSPTGAFSSCAIGSAATCSFGGNTFASGSTISGYTSATVPYGTTCSSAAVQVSCTNGALSPASASSSCVVQSPANCIFAGQTVASGSSTAGYVVSSVPYGSSCSSAAVQISCTNGILNPSAASPSCAVQPPANCIFAGQTLASGTSTSGYSASSVPYNSSCSSAVVQISCTNGILNPSGASPSCVVRLPSTCIYNGMFFAHGASTTGFTAPTASNGTSCSSLATTVTCNDGTMLPLNTSPTCEQLGPASVCTVADLKAVKNYLQGSYVQTCDIDLSSEPSWPSIGDLSSPFTGVFDGQGHTISNLKGSNGLFGAATGILKNIKISNAKIDFTSGNVGILVGSQVGGLGLGSAENCTVSGALNNLNTAFPQNIGGLAGNGGRIRSSSASVTITDNVSSAYAMYVGGLIGNVNGTIENSKSSGSIHISVSAFGVGGLVGGDIYALPPADILNSSSSVSINAPLGDNIGGIAGFVQGQYDGNEITLKNSFSTGDILGYRGVGGLVGSTNGPIGLIQSWATGNISASGGGVGGLAGGLVDADISQSYFKGSVSSPLGTVGGLVGGIAKGPSTGGCANSIAIQDSYADAQVKGSFDVGGLVGASSLCGVIAKGSYMTRTYFNGTISSSSSAGGLISSMENMDRGGGVEDLKVTSSYWDSSTSGISSSAAGQSVSGAFLRSPSSLGWDFSNIWKIGSDGLPDLRLTSTSQTGNFPSSFVAKLTVLYSAPSGLIYGASAGGLTTSQNEGLTWQSESSNLNLGVGSVTTVRISENGYRYIGTKSGLFISSNDGLSYQRATVDQGLPGNHIVSLTVDGQGNIYVVTHGGIGISKDHGASFKAITDSAITAFFNVMGAHSSPPTDAIAVGPSGTIYFMMLARLYVSNSGGLLSPSVNGQIEKLQFSPKGSVFGTGRGSVTVDANENIFLKVDELYISTNRGETFTKIEPTQGLPKPFSGAAFNRGGLTLDSSGRIFVIHTLQSGYPYIYASNPGGLSAVGGNPASLSFTQMGLLGPSTSHLVDSVAVAPNGAVYAHRWGYGVFKSTDGGAHFTLIPGTL